jgi:hypothetical protein
MIEDARVNVASPCPVRPSSLITQRAEAIPVKTGILALHWTKKCTIECTQHIRAKRPSHSLSNIEIVIGVEQQSRTTVHMRSVTEVLATNYEEFAG